MKKIFIIPVALAALIISSCKDKSTFTIAGTVEHPGELKKIYLMETDSSSVKVVDSTQLNEDGKFQFKRNSPYANLYKIRAGGSVFDLIAQNGDEITFKTDMGNNAHPYDISGSSESLKIKEFNEVSNKYGEPITKISTEYEAKAQALGKESDSLRKVFMPLYEKAMADYSNAILKFALDNKTTLAGFYALTSLNPDTYEQDMVKYADDIKDNFKDNPGVQRFQKQIDLIRPISIGHKAPDFTIGGIDGKPVKLSDYKGRYVMLDFWASWCAPCRAENPNVVKQYAAFHDKGFNILGISLDEDQAAWKGAINQDKLTWAHASDLKKFDGPTERLYNINAIPSSFIIDPHGIIIAKNKRGPALEEFLNKTFLKP